eukprot:4361838-Amphidinium_carterae.2
MAQGQDAGALELELEVVVPLVETNLPAPPYALGPHLRVVEHATFAQCLNCFRLVTSWYAHGYP